MSQFSKEVMIKLVVSTIPIYLYHVMLSLSKNLIDWVDSRMAQFWRGHDKEDNRTYWMGKDVLFTPRFKVELAFQRQNGKILLY